MPEREIKHIFFDLDDTLWDFTRNAALTFEFIFRKRALSLVLDDFLEAYRPINEKYWSLYRNREIEVDQLRFLRLSDSFNAIDHQVPEEMIHLLAKDFIEHLIDFNHLFPDALETLQYLFPKYSLHILTNGFSAVQERKIYKANIHNYFKTITASEENGIKKPDPEIFKLALEKAKAFKENSLMIGDNFEADILGAQAVGLKTIYFKTYPQPAFGGIQISKLSELKKLL